MRRNSSKLVFALLVAAAPFFAVACGTTYSSPPPDYGSGDIQGSRYETMRVLSERLVDRLLSSPRYGERKEAVWLDLARFADTHGYQMDRDRPVWPYRDWVINAFNANQPYDMHELIRKVADEGDFFELQEAFARNIVTGFGHEVIAEMNRVGIMVDLSHVGGATSEEAILARKTLDDLVETLLRAIQATGADVVSCALRIRDGHGHERQQREEGAVLVRHAVADRRVERVASGQRLRSLREIQSFSNLLSRRRWVRWSLRS